MKPPEAATTACDECGAELEWFDCWNCDEDGMMDHDCGEDTCCCLDPYNNVTCDVCKGNGGWECCLACAQKRGGCGQGALRHDGGLRKRGAVEC